MQSISAGRSFLNPMKFIKKNDNDDLSIMYEKLQKIESIGKKKKEKQVAVRRDGTTKANGAKYGKNAFGTLLCRNSS